tara:strand:+ start:40 stop:447 length:408 start_codon:yes stop_codon:yes gene_type:complete
MTSSQPIATPNALNFTPDNKRCYTYSGGVNVGAGTTDTLLTFETNSEYIVARFQFTIHAKNQSDNSTFILSLNDTVIFYAEKEDTESAGMDSPLEIIIPPFTAVKITGAITGSGDIDHAVVMWGDVYGMTETGFQ